MAKLVIYQDVAGTESIFEDFELTTNRILIGSGSDNHLVLDSPDVVLDPQICDRTLTEKVLKLAMLLEDVHIVHGMGAMSTAHTEADIDRVAEAYRRALEKIKGT